MNYIYICIYDTIMCNCTGTQLFPDLQYQQYPLHLESYAITSHASQQRAAAESGPRRLKSESTAELQGVDNPWQQPHRLSIQLTLCLVREGAYGLEYHCTSSMNALSVVLDNEGPLMLCFPPNKWASDVHLSSQISGQSQTIRRLP